MPLLYLLPFFRAGILFLQLLMLMFLLLFQLLSIFLFFLVQLLLLFLSFLLCFRARGIRGRWTFKRREVIWMSRPLVVRFRSGIRILRTVGRRLVRTSRFLRFHHAMSVEVAGSVGGGDRRLAMIA